MPNVDELIIATRIMGNECIVDDTGFGSMRVPISALAMNEGMDDGTDEIQAALRIGGV